MKLRTALGSVIQDVRLARGMTLRELHEVADVSLGYISEVERGQKEASSEILESLARGLSTTVSDLVVDAGIRMADYEALIREANSRSLART
jgi:transcriptional regulator with XRE-family HTH domain